MGQPQREGVAHQQAGNEGRRRALTWAVGVMFCSPGLAPPLPPHQPCCMLLVWCCAGGRCARAPSAPGCWGWAARKVSVGWFRAGSTAGCGGRGGGGKPNRPSSSPGSRPIQHAVCSIWNVCKQAECGIYWSPCPSQCRLDKSRAYQLHTRYCAHIPASIASLTRPH